MGKHLQAGFTRGLWGTLKLLRGLPEGESSCILRLLGLERVGVDGLLDGLKGRAGR